ncbi:hypothetical protein ACFYZJ_20650 [Streptomyces sp. NPDC001848]
MEAVVGTDLTHGAKYEVCVTVADHGAGAPNICNANTAGKQYQVTYK